MEKKIMGIILCVVIIIGVFVFIINRNNYKLEGDVNPQNISSIISKSGSIIDVTYTPNSITMCDNGVCSKRIYNEIQFVEEDGTWKEINKARNIKGYYNKAYLRNDTSNYDINFDIINFTYLNGTLWVNLKGKYPLKICYPYSFINGSGDNEFIDTEIRCISEDVTFNKNNQFFNFYINFITGDISINNFNRNYPDIIGLSPLILDNLTLGSNSTTVFLNSSIYSGGDGYTSSAATTTEYGAFTNLYLVDTSTTDYYAMNKYDISEIIDTMSVVINATSCLNLVSNSLDNTGEGFNLSLHGVNASFRIGGSLWTEGTGTGIGNACSGSELCWSTQPSTSTDYNTSFEEKKYYYGGSGEPIGWQCWNATQIFNYSWDAWQSLGTDYRFMSLFYRSTDVFGSPAVGDALAFTSKESGTTKPYFNITYISYAPRNNITHDTYTSSVSPNANFGNYTRLSTWYEGPNNYNSFFIINLSDIPDTATINYFNLSLYTLSCDENDKAFYGVTTNNWTESNTTYNYNQPIITTVIGTTDNCTNGWTNFSITPSQVEDHLSGDNISIGFYTNSTWHGGYGFYSKEYYNVSRRPMIYYNYTISAGGDCWSYDYTNKLIYVPQGCTYYKSGSDYI